MAINEIHEDAPSIGGFVMADLDGDGMETWRDRVNGEPVLLLMTSSSGVFVSKDGARALAAFLTRWSYLQSQEQA